MRNTAFCSFKMITNIMFTRSAIKAENDEYLKQNEKSSQVKAKRKK